MYAAGKLPDHVTRYNHKPTDRWMTPEVRRGSSVRVVTDVMLMSVCVASLIVAAVMLMQGGV